MRIETWGCNECPRMMTEKEKENWWMSNPTPGGLEIQAFESATAEKFCQHFCSLACLWTAAKRHLEKLRSNLATVVELHAA